MCKIRRESGFVPGQTGLVPRPTGPKSLCLCAFCLPESKGGVWLRRRLTLSDTSWEVLKGVGVDGAGGNLPFFFAFLRQSPLFWRGISPFVALFFAFLRFILEQGANNCNLLEKWGIHSDHVCTDPVENFPNKCAQSLSPTVHSANRNWDVCCRWLICWLWLLLLLLWLGIG